MSSKRRIVAALSAALFLSAYAEAHLSFLDPQGPIAAQQRTHFFLILALVMVVVLPVLVLTPILLWKFRYGRGATYRPKWDFSWKLEVLIWGVPTAIVAMLAVPLWLNTTRLDPWKPLPSTEPPLRVQVVGYDWKWLFVYPDQGIATVNDLVFPAGQPLELDITSETVMQSLFIPALGSQVYAMGAGMVTKLHLAAFAPGTFQGKNTQYNGKGFHEQRFYAEAVPVRAFSNWVEEVRANGITWGPETHAIIARRSTAHETAKALGTDAPRGDGLIHLRGVPDGFFESIVRMGLMPHTPEGEAGQ